MKESNPLIFVNCIELEGWRNHETRVANLKTKQKTTIFRLQPYTSFPGRKSHWTKWDWFRSMLRFLLLYIATNLHFSVPKTFVLFDTLKDFRFLMATKNCLFTQLYKAMCCRLICMWNMFSNYNYLYMK